MSLVIPSVLLASMASKADEFLHTRNGFRIKQHYLIRAITCLVVAALTVTPLHDFLHDPRLAYYTEYATIRWATCGLLSYELYFMLQTAAPYGSDALSLTEVRRSLLTCLNLWLAPTMLSEGAFHAFYLLFVVAIPEGICALVMFEWVELANLTAWDCTKLIGWTQNWFRVGMLCVYIPLSVTFGVWVAPVWSLWAVVASAAQLYEVLTSPWMKGEEPYANGNDWLQRHANRSQ